MRIDPAQEQLIHELGLSMALADLKLDPEGGCAIRLDKKIVVNLQSRDLENELWLYADMGEPVIGTEVYGDLLRGNLFWSATLGATLSLSGDEPPHVIIALPLAWRGLEITRLCQQLENFVNTVEEWSDFIAESNTDDTNDTSNTSEQESQAQAAASLVAGNILMTRA